MIRLPKINNPITWIAAFFFVFAISTSHAQTLKEQQESLMKVSTSYEEYKVVKIATLNAFWVNIQDTIKVLQTEEIKLTKEIKNLKSELSTSQQNLLKTNSDLETSNYVRDRISFLGMPITKGAYNFIVWSIIFILGGLVAFFYLRFKRSNIVTRNAKKECDTLFNEFDDFKKSTRDKELILKRELQTAINTIEDLKQ